MAKRYPALILTGQDNEHTQVSNVQGQFRFMGLSPDAYQLNAILEGFNSVRKTVEIKAGHDTTIRITMSVLTIEE